MSVTFKTEEEMLNVVAEAEEVFSRLGLDKRPPLDPRERYDLYLITRGYEANKSFRSIFRVLAHAYGDLCGLQNRDIALKIFCLRVVAAIISIAEEIQYENSGPKESDGEE